MEKIQEFTKKNGYKLIALLQLALCFFALYTVMSEEIRADRKSKQKIREKAQKQKIKLNKINYKGKKKELKNRWKISNQKLKKN